MNNYMYIYIIMPSIDKNYLLNNLKNINKETFFTDYPIFVETGTFVGYTTLIMEKLFSKVYTIEIDKTFYENQKNAYKGNKINFYLGDSGVVLNDICPQIKLPAIFFLDAHPCGGKSGRGIKDIPLYEEIKAINDKFTSNCIIIIDDVRLFGCNIPGENWSDINDENLISVVKDRLFDYYKAPSDLDKQDRLILHLSPMR